MKKCLLFFLCAMSFIFSLPLSAQDDTHASSPWSIDHVVIIVNNLSSATRDFTQLGFTVIPGGKTGRGFNQNALISFFDGTYIELFSPTDPNSSADLETLKNQNKLNTVTDNLNAMNKRFIDHIANGEGLADFALRQPDVDWEEELINLHDMNLFFAGPIPMYRTKPDGRRVEWEVAVPDTNVLPFLISNETARPLRVGKFNPLLQKNWVAGIASITIAVRNLEKAIQAYQTLLGINPVDKPAYTPPNNVKIAVFKVGTIDLILAQPTDTNGPLYQYLTTHGTGPFRLRLYTTNKHYVGKLNPALTHKADIKLIYK